LLSGRTVRLGSVLEYASAGMDVDRVWAIIDRAADGDALRAPLEPLSREELADVAGLLREF
jgi:hypothetical protein